MRNNPTLQQLVSHWGQMARRWGISRMVAEIHALLFFSARPTPADELVETLGVARSHVSNSLKELQNWGVIKVVRLEGDRRDHFESIKDTWQLFEVLLEERKRRELDPTLQLLRETAAQMSQSPDPSPVRQRVSEMLAFYEEVDRFYSEVKRLPLSARVGLLRAGGKIGTWLR
ncbi:hypothetical protein SDC9_139165 [bioreactor metagenome]|uniref:HTH marR-type domain-containing protein n=1 Tax=bioreactor metagenome TaxID=1076179 RepID=A0A645DRU9_9ZZZZ